MSVYRFENTSVLVTGGGRGIGRAVALAFAAAGARVAVASRSVNELEAVCAEMAGTARATLALRCDVSDEAEVRQCVQRVVAGFGTVDVLVNCAGLFTMGPSADFSTAGAAELAGTNYLGTFTMCREVGRGMLERGHGKIVNFASLLSFVAFPERAAYAASKAAVLQLTRVLGVEWAARGVNVNAVAPGMIRIETPHPGVSAGTLTERQIVERIPAGRRGHPGDITGPVLFLSSSDADYVCGQSLVVDGGWLSYGYL